MNSEEKKSDEAKPEAYSSLLSAPVLPNDVEVPKNAAQVQSPVRLKRGLKARHSSMIAIGGGMGTGLIIGTGSALKNAGPASLFLSFAVMGLTCYVVMGAVAEMSCFRPDNRGFAGYAARYVDKSLGFAMGWNYLFKYLVVFGNNLNACALVLSYWDDTTSPAVYITTFAVACILCNMLPVRAFGEAEFWMSGLKLLVVLGLIILNIVLAAGGGPTGDAPGFRNWQHGLAFRPYKAGGDLGRFLGFWSTLTTSLFAFIGTELVCVTVGETANPRKSISKATKQTLLRILVCYVGGVFSLGLVVPCNSPQLAKATSAATSASSSPFVVAIQLAAIPILPAIVNGALLIFVSSAANSDQYISSRTLHSLAMEGQAPSWLKKTMKNGIPLRSNLVTFPFFALAYINLASDGAKAFGYLSSTVTMFGGLMWWGMLLTHIRFMKACKAQGISRESLPHRSPLQPYASYVAFFIVNLVLFFKGFPGFIGGFDWRSFITNYIGIPIFIILYFGWKIASGSKIVDLNEVDMTYMDEQDLDVLEH